MRVAFPLLSEGSDNRDTFASNNQLLNKQWMISDRRSKCTTINTKEAKPPRIGRDTSTNTSEVLYDDGVEHSRCLSLRVPLTAIRSTTYAFYPDESHSSIRRVFTPSHAPHTKRHFCGFCGTPLSYWSEEIPEEAEFVRVNMGSLKSESVEMLQDAGLLEPSFDDSENKETRDASTSLAKRTLREIRGNPWFEEMIEGSDLGRIKRIRGGRTSSDGNTTVEWDIVEIGVEEEGIGGIATGKRKLGEFGEGENDTVMRG
ncbi:MAG: hypothetical protein Q9163_005722 [Psora crenata]